jgi:glycosyltransferase involved in cell wall biosynthesis
VTTGRTGSVGVVVIARDAMPHLAAALASVHGQRGVEIGDVVVVDGGSTDGSAEHATSVPGVRVVAQNGVGIGHARNVGLAHVDGDVVAFLDSDDRWPVDSLARRLDPLAGADAVVGRVVTVALPGEEVPEHRRSGLGVPAIGYTPSALVARRATLDTIGPFDEQLAIGADSDWFARLIDSQLSVAVVDDVVAHKGVRAGSLSVEVDRYRRELLDVARSHVRRRRRPD